REVMKDVLTEAMDLDGLKTLLRGIEEGKIRCVAVDTPVPSQFSHEILNANPYAFLDDAPLEERRARAVEMRRVLPESVLEEVGKLDPAAIEQVRKEAWPDVRDDDELHDVLHTLVAFPVSCLRDDDLRDYAASVSAWKDHFEKLLQAGRATIASCDNRRYWVAAERVKDSRLLFPTTTFEHAVAEVDGRPTSRDEALLALVIGWMMHSGPV